LAFPEASAVVVLPLPSSKPKPTTSPDSGGSVEDVVVGTGTVLVDVLDVDDVVGPGGVVLVVVVGDVPAARRTKRPTDGTPVVFRMKSM
jgi:hypothetical protein